MKLFKKLFSVVAVCIGCVVLAASVGCNTLSNDGWTEVQSITYTTENGTTTLTSTYRFNITSEDIEQAEYESADESVCFTESLGWVGILPPINTQQSGGMIDVDKSEFKAAIEKVGDVYYYHYTKLEYIGEPYAGNDTTSSAYFEWLAKQYQNPDNWIETSAGYRKTTIDSYTANYVKLRFTSDKGIEFYEDDNTITKVYPITYTVTYFKN